MTQIKDYELMGKIKRFTRQNQRQMMWHEKGTPCAESERPHGRHHGRMGGIQDQPGMPPPMGHRGPHGRGGPMPGSPHGGNGMRNRPLTRERLLVILSKNPEGIRQKNIAEKVGINQSSTSELINKLESDGYIQRTVDPQDKRATLLFLTEKGQARAAEVEDEREALFEGTFSVLTEEEKQTLSDLLDKLLAAQDKQG